MNYLSELLAFDNWLETSELSSSAIALWFAIMQTANKAGWKNPLTIPISTLEVKSGMERSSVYRARNRLKQAGLIDFRERGGKRCSEYTINSLVCQYATQSGTLPDTLSETQADTQSGTQTDTIPKQDKTKQDIPPIVPPKEERFDAFWSAYPRKVGKDAARKAFAKRKPSQKLLEQMLAAIEQQKKSEQWQKNNGQFIPLPTTWLNQGRWEDEVKIEATGKHRTGYEQRSFNPSGLEDIFVDLEKMEE